MKETVHFTKMQGAGNDYIYVDTQMYDIPDPEKAAIAWSAYHTGIGSDGLVLIGKPQDGRRADYSMRIFNELPVKAFKLPCIGFKITSRRRFCYVTT